LSLIISLLVIGCANSDTSTNAKDAGSTADADTATDTDKEGTIVGTVFRNESEQLQFCIVIAYPDDYDASNPDKLWNLTESATSTPILGSWTPSIDYRLPKFVEFTIGSQLYVGAICDSNDNGDIDSGDVVGAWYGGSAGTLVTVPATGIDIQLIKFGN
jgi:hypothetical protein